MKFKGVKLCLLSKSNKRKQPHHVLFPVIFISVNCTERNLLTFLQRSPGTSQGSFHCRGFVTPACRWTISSPVLSGLPRKPPCWSQRSWPFPFSVVNRRLTQPSQRAGCLQVFWKEAGRSHLTVTDVDLPRMNGVVVTWHIHLSSRCRFIFICVFLVPDWTLMAPIQLYLLCYSFSYFSFQTFTMSILTTRSHQINKIRHVRRRNRLN